MKIKLIFLLLTALIAGCSDNLPVEVKPVPVQTVRNGGAYPMHQVDGFGNNYGVDSVQIRYDGTTWVATAFRGGNEWLSTPLDLNWNPGGLTFRP